MAGIYTISPRKSFLDVLALKLLKNVGNSPEDLSEYMILLPTRRACRSLRETFLRHTNSKALVLPYIHSIGDSLDEDDMSWFKGDVAEDLAAPPPISMFKRLMVLSRMIMKKAEVQGINLSAHTALILADDLARLLDEVVVENLSWNNLAKIVPENLNSYWQEVLSFLRIVSRQYPEYLKEAGLTDIKVYQVNRIKRLANIWRKHPPSRKVIAAGSTVTQPAIGELLSVIAEMDYGCVILPGLDKTSDDETFSGFGLGHYQYGMKNFLDKVDYSRYQIGEWGEDIEAFTCQRSRQRLIVETLKPAKQTYSWSSMPDFFSDVMDGLQKVECSDEREEALVIALIMRHALETKGKTAALVTSDVNLGKRVSLELERFGINVDSSAGTPLYETPNGVYMKLLLDFCLYPGPVSLLSLLKHPLSSAGMGRIECLNLARKFDRALRGKSKVYGLEDLRRSLGDDSLKEAFDGITAILKPLLVMSSEGLYPLEKLLHVHIKISQEFSIDGNGVWKGSAGKALSSLLGEMLHDALEFSEIPFVQYPKFFSQFLGFSVVRDARHSHKRLAILGPMEARLQNRDLMIIGGLNEGFSPRLEEAGPWMSYKMRDEFGLPSFHQKIGISASDFAGCFMAHEVVLTRALKSSGTPTIASRWLQRLDAVIEGKSCKWQDNYWQEYARIMDRPAYFQNAVRAEFSPPIFARPVKLSVSAIQSLMQDPYAVYARYILKLKPMEDLEPVMKAQDYGSAVHEVFAWFTKEYPSIPENALEIINAKAEEVFRDMGIASFWLTRFKRASVWFIDDLKNRPAGTFSQAEVQGVMSVDTIGITAIADRIDADLKNRTAVVIDYKTGAPPKDREIVAGYAPQLPIEALIVQEGGFEGIPRLDVSEMRYYRVTGKDEGIEPRLISPKDVTKEELLALTVAGLKKLVDSFYVKGIPYTARPDALRKIRYSDYEHLERVQEWDSLSGDEDGGSA